MKRGNPSKLPDLSGFGAIEILRPLKGSPRSCVFLVTDGKRQLVAKTTTQSEASLEWVVRAKSFANEVGFVTSQNLRSTSGSLSDKGWKVETFETGTPYPEASLPDLANAMRDFRTISDSLPQRPGFLASCDFLYQDKGSGLDLTALPHEVAEAARAAWTEFCSDPLVTVHGDLGAGNIFMTDVGKAILLDWDEARKDCALFDEYPLIPRNRTTNTEKRAYIAWETARGWTTEPDYARRMADQLLALS